jgi:hypothetical protein
MLAYTARIIFGQFLAFFVIVIALSKRKPAARVGSAQRVIALSRK